MEKFKAVIFDLDGTLLDSLADIADSMNSTLEKMGHPGHSLKEYRYLVGDGVENLVRRSLPAAARNEESIRSGLESMREEYGYRWSRNTRPYDGIPDLLIALKERRLRLAVLSNKADFFTRSMVEHFFGSATFDTIMGAGPSHPKKPDPAMALEIARAFSISPERIIFLGDTMTDMETARRAGMFALGALWGFRDAAELNQYGAQGLIQAPMELLDYL